MLINKSRLYRCSLELHPTWRVGEIERGVSESEKVRGRANIRYSIYIDYKSNILEYSRSR